MSVNSRQKGKAGELEAAAKLQYLLSDPTIHRCLDQPRDGGYDLDGDKLVHFAWEVKRTNQPRLLEWFNGLAGQAAICEDHRIPVVMWRRNMAPWRYFVELEELRMVHYVRLINALGGD